MTVHQHHVKKIVLWSISIVIAGQMLWVGSLKVLGAMGWSDNVWMERFVAWGYPEWFPLVVGISEILAAILIMTPRFALQGAAIVGAVMYAAVITEWVNNGFIHALYPMFFLLLAGTVLAVRWPRMGAIDPVYADIAGEEYEDADYEPSAEPEHVHPPKTTVPA